MENRSHCPASADVSEVSDFMTCAWERLQPGMSAGIINTERTGDVYSFAATSHHGSSARGFTVREEREELDRGHYTETRRSIRASTHGLPNDESLVVSHFGKTMELAVHTGDKREREIAREFDRRFLRPPTDAEITNLEIQASMALRREQWVSALRVGHLILKHQPQNVDALLAVGIASGAQGDAITSELADEVRTAAAYACGRMKTPRAIEGLAAGLSIDFGKERGCLRSPEVKAHLLRMALLRFPRSAATREMLKNAIGSEFLSVKFMALAAL